MSETTSNAATPQDDLQIRVHGPEGLPTLVYLPGTHGDWSIIAGLRNRLLPRFRFVELTYPRTVTWSLEDYARNIRDALLANGIRKAWLIGESFGSQPAWLLADASDPRAGFECQGIILAGGFSKHPFPWGVPVIARSFGGLMRSEKRRQRAMNIYARYVRTFYERTPETDASLQEFAQRRTVEDAAAALHRLRLIRANDPRALAQRVRVPVYSLSGVWDPIVPWYLVIPWLRRHCAGFKDSKLITTADHNVFFSAPTKSAETITRWLTGGNSV